MTYATFDEVAARIASLATPSLIAIDGLPVSGKSTLADRLAGRFAIPGIFLDDFVLPERLWPVDRSPAFPFTYTRYADFMATVRGLADSGEVSYRPFEWSAGDVAQAPRRVTLDRHMLVEGVSALHPDLCDKYGLKLFVASDRASTLDAAVSRGVGSWAHEWRDWFLPSVDLYFATDPATRADLIPAGRGTEVPQ